MPFTAAGGPQHFPGVLRTPPPSHLASGSCQKVSSHTQESCGGSAPTFVICSGRKELPETSFYVTHQQHLVRQCGHNYHFESGSGERELPILKTCNVASVLGQVSEPPAAVGKPPGAHSSPHQRFLDPLLHSGTNNGKKHYKLLSS